MMIEKVILDYLTENASVPVKMMRPETPPEKYLMIEKTGSVKVNRLTTSTFAVQSYAPTLFEAAELNEEAKELMDDLVALKEISSSKIVSDYNFTNAATKQPRYQAVYEITHY